MLTYNAYVFQNHHVALIEQNCLSTCKTLTQWRPFFQQFLQPTEKWWQASKTKQRIKVFWVFNLIISLIVISTEFPSVKSGSRIFLKNRSSRFVVMRCRDVWEMFLFATATGTHKEFRNADWTLMLTWAIYCSTCFRKTVTVGEIYLHKPDSLSADTIASFFIFLPHFHRKKIQSLLSFFTHSLITNS